MDVHEIADAVDNDRMDPYKGLVAIEGATKLATAQLQQMKTCMKLEADRVRELACQLEVAAARKPEAAGAQRKPRQPADWSLGEHDVCQCPIGAHATVPPGTSGVGQTWAGFEADIKGMLGQQQEMRESEATDADWETDPRGNISTVPTMYHLAAQLGCLDELVNVGVAKLKDASVLKASTLASLKEFAQDAGTEANNDGSYDDVTLAIAVNHVLKSTPMHALACMWLRSKNVAVQGFASAQREQLQCVLMGNFSVCDVWANAPYTAVSSFGCIPVPLEDPRDKSNGWWGKYVAHLEWLHTQFVCRGIRTYAQLMTATGQRYQKVPGSMNCDLSEEFVDFVVKKQLGGTQIQTTTAQNDRLRAANFYFNHHCTFDPRGYMATASFSTGESDYDGCRTGIADCDMAEDCFDFKEFVQLVALGKKPEELGDLDNFCANDFYAMGTGEITDGYTGRGAKEVVVMCAYESGNDDYEEDDDRASPEWSDPSHIAVKDVGNPDTLRSAQGKLTEIIGNMLRCPAKPFGVSSDGTDAFTPSHQLDAFVKDMHFVTALREHVTKEHPELAKGGAEYSRVTEQLAAHLGNKESRGVAALNDIRVQQRRTGLVIPPVKFARLACEIAQDFKTDLYFAPRALEALHHVSEAYLVRLYEDCMVEAIHGGRTVIKPKDIQVTRRVRGERA